MTRKSSYKHPNQHLADLDARRAEILEQAPAQAAAMHIDEQAIIEAMVQVDSVARAKGDPELGQMIAEMEMEHIAQDQSLDALNNILEVLHEAADEYRQDSKTYSNDLKEEWPTYPEVAPST